MTWHIECADVLAWAAEYAGEKYHAILCDPPYELAFMGKSWDQSGIAFQPATWAALAEHLHPGGFIMAFASSRGWHRLACAMEDAGLIIHPTIFCWITGQGFPKSTRIQFRSGKAPHNIACEDLLSEYLQDVQSPNAQNEMNITQDFQCDCQGNCHSCDELSQNDLDSAQGILPLQDGVHGRNHGDQHEDGQAYLLTNTYPDVNNDHPSNLDCQTRFDPQSRDCQVPCNIQSGNSSNTLPASQTENHKKVCHKSCMSDWDAGSVSSSPSNNSSNRVYSNIPQQDDIVKSREQLLEEIWVGHRYGLQALKPAAEPIIVAQKPYAGRPVDSITQTGAGSLWIDGGRVATGENLNGGAYCGNGKRNTLFGLGNSGREFQHPSGRWPANVLLQHAEGCRRVGVKRVTRTDKKGGRNHPSSQFVSGNNYERIMHGDPDGTEAVADWICEPECPVRRLNLQAGPSVARPVKAENIGKSGDGNHKGLFGNGSIVQSGYYDNSSNVSRFYFQADWSYEIAERLADALPFYYCAKSSRRERDAGLDLNTEHELGHNRFDTCGNCGGYILQNPDRPSACKCEIPKRQHNKVRGNPHPTIKPIALTRYLATLLLPPPAYAPRRIVIPFCGVVSEMIGAGLAGWEHITGIEKEPDYCEIGEARLAHWLDAVQMGMDL